MLPPLGSPHFLIASRIESLGDELRADVEPVARIHREQMGGRPAGGEWSQRLPGDGDSIRNDPRHAGAPAYGWPRPSVPAAGEQVTAGLQLDQAENLGTLNVTVVLRPLVLGESPLVGTASQLLKSRLDVGVNAKRDDTFRGFDVEAAAQGIEHPVKRDDRGGWFHKTQSTRACGAYQAPRRS